MTTPRGYAAATLLPNGTVLMAGGSGGGDSAEIYHPAAGTWAVTSFRFGCLQAAVAEGRQVPSPLLPSSSGRLAFDKPRGSQVAALAKRLILDRNILPWMRRSEFLDAELMG